MTKATTLIIGSLAAFACRSAAPPADPAAITKLLTPVVSTAPSTSSSASETPWVIEEDKQQPNAILTVEVSIPHLFQRQTYRLPLRRWQAPEGHFPVLVAHGEAADGWGSAGGDGTGYVGGVNVVETTKDTVIVEVSFSGKGHDLKEVDLTQRVSIGWGQEFDGKLGEGGRIHAEFKHPGM
jgi:hypothetical protein